MCNKIISMVRH